MRKILSWERHFLHLTTAIQSQLSFHKNVMWIESAAPRLSQLIDQMRLFLPLAQAPTNGGEISHG
jgi:hypothetical protein